MYLQGLSYPQRSPCISKESLAVLGRCSHSPRDAGDAHDLLMRLDTDIGYDRSGVIYTSTATATSSSGVDGLNSSSISPLALKIARPGRREYLAREASVYDYLHGLQGVALPRCHGWFKTAVPDDMLQ